MLKIKKLQAQNEIMPYQELSQDAKDIEDNQKCSVFQNTRCYRDAKT